jgi:hypothetical protein
LSQKWGTCSKCGKERVLATPKSTCLCYTCYRQEEKIRERPERDRHNPGLTREHDRLFKGLTSVMSGLKNLGCVRDDIFDIRRILQPYLEPIQAYLDLNTPEPEPPPEPIPPEKEPDPEPSEQTPESRSPFTTFTFDPPGTEPGFQKKPRKKIRTMPE